MAKLTEAKIKDIAEDYGLGIFVEPTETDPRDFIWFNEDLIPFARAILAMAEP